MFLFSIPLGLPFSSSGFPPWRWMSLAFIGIILPLESPYGMRGNGMGFKAPPAQIIPEFWWGISQVSIQARSWEVQGWENRESELIEIISTRIRFFHGAVLRLCRDREGFGLSLHLTRGFPVNFQGAGSKSQPGVWEQPHSRGFSRSWKAGICSPREPARGSGGRFGCRHGIPGGGREMFTGALRAAPSCSGGAKRCPCPAVPVPARNSGWSCRGRAGAGERNQWGRAGAVLVPVGGIYGAELGLGGNLWGRAGGGS